MESRRKVIDSVLRGPGTTTPAQRQAAFDDRATGDIAPLLAKVVSAPATITDADVAAVKQSDDAIYEQVVAAALGIAQRQLDAALAALDEACGSKR